MDDLVQGTIEESIRAVGILVLKAATLGRYRPRAAARLFEGAIGLVAAAAALWLMYHVAISTPAAAAPRRNLYAACDMLPAACPDASFPSPLSSLS